MTTLEKTLRWIVIGGIFLLPFVPLLVTTSLFFPYITGKNFVFRIVVEVVTGAWLALALVSPAYRPRRSWILGAFALFVALIALSNGFGVNPFKSFWSNFERMDGWVTIAHLLVYTVVAASVLRTERLWDRLWWTTLGVSVLLSVYGLLQVAGTLTLGQGGASGLSARVDATFGNPIYLAVYMLFHIFIAALLWARSRREGGESSFLASWGYGIAIALSTLTLFLTGTRGTMLGLIGGAVLTVLILAVFGGSRRMRFAAIASIVAVIVLGGTIKLAKDTAFVKSVGFLDRLASISLTDQTIASRFTNMSIAWQGVKERPVLGWGQENYAIVFDKYYDPRMYANEPWFDRVHDIIFDWWIAGGTLGLLAYLSIFATTLWVLWRNPAFDLSERAILTGLLAGYFVHNLTVFDNVTSYILFGTVLAYIVYRSTEASGAPAIPERGSLSMSAMPYTALGCAILTWAVAWGVNANALSENRALIAAISPQGDVTKNLELFKQAIAYHSIGTQEAREQLSQAATQVATASNVSIEVKQKFFDTAVSEMQAQMAESPLDARFPLFLGVVYDAYGDHADAAVAFQKAHELSPKKQAIYYQLGQNAWAQGEVSQAVGYFKNAFELLEENADARINYAAAVIRAGDYAKAQELIAPLIEIDRAADARILAAYVATKQVSRAIPLWQAHIVKTPTDIQAYFTLAAMYYELGNRAQAIAILNQAKAVAPGAAAQVDQVILQVQSGTAVVQ